MQLTLFKKYANYPVFPSLDGFWLPDAGQVPEAPKADQEEEGH